MQAHLVYLAPKQKTRKFYILYTTPTLFGEWALVHTWGKVGRKGRCKEEWFPSSKEANLAAGMVLAQKTQMGYKQRPVQLRLF